MAVTRKGLDIFNPSNGRFRNFGKESGIFDGSTHLNAVTTDVNGDIWIASRKGLIKYMPDEGLPWQTPAMNLLDVEVLFSSIDEEIRRKFKHDENHFTFKFAALWYSEPEKVIYQYKLEGYDPDWVDSRDNRITYPHLDDGNYIFKVRSSTSGLFEDAEIVSYEFAIFKPLWERPWFISMMALLTVLLITGGIALRDKQQKYRAELSKAEVILKFQMLKNQINPHFLFNSFNTLVTIIQENQEQAVQYVSRLADFFRNFLLYQEKEVIYLEEELDILNEYIYLQQERYGENLKFDISVNPDDLDKKISPLTLQLLAENAIKHNVISMSKPLLVKIKSEDDYIVVENKIQPKQQESRSTRTGLDNISKRYEILGGKEVVISNTDGNFKVKVPLL